MIYEKYKDLSYREKREALRELSYKEPISNAVSIVADEIYLKFINVKAWTSIKKYLIDGYLAFEKIYAEDGSSLLGYKEIDPLRLIPSIRNDKHIWIQDINGEKKEFSEDKIVYISYSDFNIHTSYVESLIRPYESLKSIEDLLVTNSPGITYPGDFTLQYLKANLGKATCIPEYNYVDNHDVMQLIIKRYDLFIKKHVSNLSKIDFTKVK